MEEKGWEDSMLQTRTGMLEMKTLIARWYSHWKRQCQGMTMDWIGQEKRSLQLRRQRLLKYSEGLPIRTLKQPTKKAEEW